MPLQQSDGIEVETMMLRYLPNFQDLVDLRCRLLKAFPDEDLSVWRAQGWRGNPGALVNDIEKLLHHSLSPDQSDLIARAQNLLLFLYRKNDEVWSFTRGATLRQLANSGLKSKTSGKRRIENQRFQLARRNTALQQLAAEKSAKHPDQSASAIAEHLKSHTIATDFKKRGLLPPPSIQSIRKIIAETVKSNQSPRPSSGKETL
jgi:hypothetical protein